MTPMQEAVLTNKASPFQKAMAQVRVPRAFVVFLLLWEHTLETGRLRQMWPSEFALCEFVPSGVTKWKIHLDDKVVLRAVMGDEVTLIYASPSVRLTEHSAAYWTSANVLPDQYVLYYKDGISDTYKQAAQYQGRVRMAHPDPQGSNMSLILTNVTKEDSGEYFFKYIQGGASYRPPSEVEPIITFQLIVTDKEAEPLHHGMVIRRDMVMYKWAEPEKPNTALIVGLSVAGALLFASLTAVGIWLFRNRNQRPNNNVEMEMERVV